jgi:hypothetical protein
MDEEQGTITTSSSTADRQSLMNDGNSNGNGNGNDDDDDDEVVTTQQQQQQQHYDDDEKDENEAASASLLIEKDHHHRRLITINDSDTDTDDHDGDTDDDDDDDEENENENDETEGFLLHTSSSLSNNDTTTGNSKMMNKKKKKKKKSNNNNNNNTKTTNNTMLPSSPLFSFLNTNDDDDEDDNHDSIFYKTLLFDDYKGLYLFGKYPLLDNNNNNPNNNGFIIKLLKFIFITYIMIGLIHVIVSQLFEDRDQLLKLKYILLYESDLIVRDCVIFFLVGRLYKKSSTGIDTIMFLSTVLFSNLYFESQNFIYFLQHSVSLYEIHCIWPWELWLFVLLLVPTIGTIVGLHVIKGYRENTLSIKITEMILCLLFFVAPMITSNYFHLHHWYAGWLLGMHCNYNTWWSKMSMAWCWGMYINGIAVYGRDPVLTCEYAYFLTVDNQCPYISCYLDAIQDVNQTDIKEMVPVNWMNCSAASSSGDYMP